MTNMNYLQHYRNFKAFFAARIVILLYIILSVNPLSGYAQDPVLPAMNLGLTNIKDAVAPPTGLYYNSYTQVFQSHGNYGGSGKELPGDLHINYLLSLHQVIYLSPIHLAGGNVHFTALLPLVKIDADNEDNILPSVNRAVTGDLTLGTGIQWSDKKLFGQSFWHRVELDVSLPTGAYDQKYNINPSSHLYALAAYYSFTYYLIPGLSIGSRNQINYNFTAIGSQARPGIFYNGNYSFGYDITSRFHTALAGYYLKQFEQDAFQGNRSYYRDKFGIDNTREQVIGIGPALSYTTSGGVFIEAKVFFETQAENRPEGTRPTLRLAIPLK